jgi:hypothetical protein
VVDETRCIGRDPALVAATVAETRRQMDEAVQKLKRERAALERQRRGGHDDPATVQRLVAIRAEISALTSSLPTGEQVAAALAEFDATWALLSPGEQAETLGLLIDHAAYDAGHGNMLITFKPTGLRTLESATAVEETAA